jgi:hypothetical protein
MGLMTPKGKNENSELQDIREILRVIVERMVTKEEFSALRGEFVAFQAETRQNFRDVRDDIAGLRKDVSGGAKIPHL